MAVWGLSPPRRTVDRTAPEEHARMDITYPIIIAAAKSWFRLGGMTIDFEGWENIPSEGGAVMATNHNSYLDFIVSGYPGVKKKRYTRFMAKKEVFDHKVGGPLMRSFHHLAVDRANGAEAFQVAVDALKAGEIVGVYPEATISRSFLIKDIKSGAVRMAVEAGVPIIPVAHFGMHRVQTKGHARDLSRGKTLVIRVGEPFVPEGTDVAADTAELKRRMSDLLEECIAAYPADQKPAGAWWVPASHGGSAPSLEEAERLDAEEKKSRAERKAAKAAAKAAAAKG
ncbi:lysophospholipid acyltransferase family protein [Nocardioides jiangxiensis]|uniref:Lysophospholipid acyltransferase family protein n=1 Tax=Nocardioides jiangxiensis TaxID=3064524 RepID=A0ABT9B035_9ACTN|nr:lysophospholipid acyltransferase family protein [Nocardioides sp. WY-20]MDO7868212.1 lysophospholipid acyltransferase family protein [Nocardioides sp. WY-20]